ncbi:MAG: D-aminoacyl-tRNA deacylase [Candidatus Eiseniibacteriota bacterium]|jgi:D-tyrosyl-tRNA(Tyr) deacylase
MRAVVTRVSRATVRVGDEETGAIDHGLLVLLGVDVDDAAADVAWMARKLAELRIFADAEGRMNRSVEEVGGAVLVISQFTLLADVRKGRRPSYVRAAPPATAERLYEEVMAGLAARGLTVACGRFGAMMDVESVNQGPVTIVLESPVTRARRATDD